MEQKRRLTTDMMEKMLDEVAQFSIDLAEDPTLPHLGIKYLQKLTSTCRSYSNRVQYYMTEVKRHENKLRIDIKTLELDLDMRIKVMLSDDVTVRQQSSIGDRHAMAVSKLPDEHKLLSEMQVELLDAEENYKLLKSKHGELVRTSNDIKSQRNMVKDDMLARLGGGDGYDKPQTGRDGSIPDGLPPPVAAKVDPTDLLDPNSQSVEFPPPIDSQHAEMMADFLSSHPRKEAKSEPAKEPQVKINSGLAVEDLLI